MPDNGAENGSSRLDRIEAALELIIGEHEAFRAEHKMLLRAQILLQESIEKQQLKIDEIADKLDGLIGAVDRMQHNNAAFQANVEAMRQNFDARLNRLEGGNS